MATTVKDEERTSKFAAVLKSANLGSPSEKSSPPRCKRLLPRWAVVTLATAAILGLGLAAVSSSGLLAQGSGGRRALTEKVRRADLVVSVAEDGNLESSHNVDVKCEIRGGSTILWIIRDGTEVKTGDELVRLDSSFIEDALTAQKITYEKAKAAEIDSRKAFDAAEIAVREYTEGTYLQTRQQLKATATVAKENRERPQEPLDHTGA